MITTFWVSSVGEIVALPTVYKDGAATSIALYAYVSYPAGIGRLKAISADSSPSVRVNIPDTNPSRTSVRPFSTPSTRTMAPLTARSLKNGCFQETVREALLIAADASISAADVLFVTASALSAVRTSVIMDSSVSVQTAYDMQPIKPTDGKVKILFAVFTVALSVVPVKYVIANSWFAAGVGVKLIVVPDAEEVNSTSLPV